MDGQGRREGCIGLDVPDPARLALLDDDEVLDAMAAFERATAALAGMSTRAAGIVANRRREQALAFLGPDASRTARDRELAEAESAVADEVRLATGLGVADARGRVRLGLAPASRADGVRRALADGSCTWLMARAWVQDTDELSAEVAADIAAKALAPTRDGTVLSYGTFRRRLARQLTLHVPAKQLRSFDLERRDAFATVTEHGTGEITVSGSGERVTAAMERVEEIARAVRRLGDSRTLAQLRSDITLDLVIFGDIPALGGPVPGGEMLTGTGARRERHDPGAPAAGFTSAADQGAGRPADPASRPAAGGAAGQAAAPHGPSDAGFDESTDGPADLPVPESVPVPEWVTYLPGGLPPAVLRIVISAASLLGVDEEPGQFEDGGYLSAQVVRDLAYGAGSVWRRLVTDPVTGEAIELSTTSYAPPPRLREAVQVRDGTCRAPDSHVPARRCDLDHDMDHARGGATSAANLSAKSRRPHAHKTRGQWTTRQHPDGAIVWTTGTGRQYTTYPMQYDPQAPGRPTPTQQDSSDAAIVASGEAPPVEHREKGRTATTRPAPRPRGHTAADPGRTFNEGAATPPDPGPPPL